jgi:hypothetical protein
MLSGDRRRRAVGPAVDCDRDREQQAESLRLRRAFDHRQQLLRDDRRHVSGKHRGQRPHLLDHRMRIGEEAVGEDDQSQQRKKREEGVESDARGHQADIVRHRPLEAPLGDVLPAALWNLARRVRLMSVAIDHASENHAGGPAVPSPDPQFPSCQSRQTVGR